MSTVIIGGLIVGLLYALTGLGLVVVYRTSKVLNFAMGGLGALVAYAARDLLSWGLPYPVVLVAGVIFGALVGALLELGIARPLRNRPHLTIALGTLGALLIIEGLLGARYGYVPRRLEGALEDVGAISLGPITLSANQTFIVLVGVAVTALLFIIIMRTRLGVSMRAVSSGPLTSSVLGVNVARVRGSAWIMGGAYGGLAALLVTPLTYLSPTSFTTFLLTAFGAVVLGGFTNIVGVIIGAFVFGIGTNLLLTFFDSSLISTYTFIGVALVLVFRPHGLFGRKEREVPEPHLPQINRRKPAAQPASSDTVVTIPESSFNTRKLKFISSAFLLVLAFAVPFFAGNQQIFLLATIITTFIGVLGLNILVGFSGQVSLGHSAFLAVGAYAAAISVDQGLSPILGILIAVLAGCICGFIVGLPSTRLSGIYLTVFTLILAVAVPELIMYFQNFTGGASGLPLTPPEFLSGTRQIYWFVTIIAVLVSGLVLLMATSRLGREWRAVRDSEDGARSLGLNPALVKLGAFTISSGLIALGGALGGMLIGHVSPESFVVFVGIYALLAVVLGGAGSLIGSLIGAVFITVIPTAANSLDIPQDLVFGVSLLVVLLVAPAGLLSFGKRIIRAMQIRWLGRSSEELWSGIEYVDESSPLMQDTVVLDRSDRDSKSVLRLENISAGYGVGPVIQNINLEIRQGEIVALIGSNGAGKSTVLRTVSGIIPKTEGEIFWQDEPVSTWVQHTPMTAARKGISHIPEGRGVFPDLTVGENLLMGTFAAPGTKLTDETLERIFSMFPILRERFKQQGGTLSGGEQQMLAIARALVVEPQLLILDEPSLGLSPRYSKQVFETLAAIASSRGVSVLLVEQNARASLKLADRAYILAHGRVTLTGSAAKVADDPALHQSYLEV